jgi:hypothetical protein
VIRVHLITEDRTGGGLDDVIRACAQARRAQEGKEPLWFPRFKGNVDGASQLLKECEKYELFRYHYNPRFDHVFYMLDARNAWRLPQLAVSAPTPPLEESLPGFIQRVKDGMVGLARGSRSAETWAGLARGFHPHVLVWERESLILPVADRLGLGEAVPDVYGNRQAAELVDEKFRPVRRLKYSKATHGTELLGRIARDPLLRATVLDSNPSLRDIIEELVALQEALPGLGT